MRKKFRSIVVDGDGSWAWNMTMRDNYYRFKTLKIWKNKKVIYERTFGGDLPYKQREKRYVITPGLVARFIKRYLKNETSTLDNTKQSNR